MEFSKVHRPADIPEEDDESWKMYCPGHGFVGIAIGGKGLFEGYTKANHPILIGWTDSEKPSFNIQGSGRRPKVKPGSVAAPELKAGDDFTIQVHVEIANGKAIIKPVFSSGEKTVSLGEIEINAWHAKGFVGIAGKGLIDFEISNFLASAQDEKEWQEIGHCECLGCWSMATLYTRSTANGR